MSKAKRIRKQKMQRRRPAYLTRAEWKQLRGVGRDQCAALLITLALLLAGCQGTSYEHKITYPSGYVDSIRVNHTKILVFTETKELSFVTPDGARLGVGWMTMDPQAAVDFAKVVVPPLWKLLSAYFAPLPVPPALEVKP